MATISEITIDKEIYTLADLEARENRLNIKNPAGTGSLLLNQAPDISTGARVTILNNNNSATGDYSTVTGNGNRVDAAASLVAGSQNQVKANSFTSIVGGESNTVNSKGSLVSGKENKVENGINNIVAGTKNSLTQAEESAVFGKESNVSGLNNLVSGAAHSVNSDTSIVSGNNNIISSTELERSKGNSVFGSGNRVTGSYNSAGGALSNAEGNYNFVYGYNLIAKGSQTVFGKYNKENATDIFQIGNGKGDERKNVLWIDEDNNLHVDSDIYFFSNNDDLRTRISSLGNKKASKDNFGIVKIADGIDVSNNGVITAEVQGKIVVDKYDSQYLYQIGDYCIYDYNIYKRTSDTVEEQEGFKPEYLFTEDSNVIIYSDVIYSIKINNGYALLATATIDSKRYLGIVSDSSSNRLSNGSLSAYGKSISIKGKDLYASYIELPIDKDPSTNKVIELGVKHNFDEFYEDIFSAAFVGRPFTPQNWTKVQIMNQIKTLEKEIVKPASNGRLGRVIIGNNINVTENGTISVSRTSKDNYGVVKIGDHINVTDGVVSIPLGSSSTYGLLKVGEGLNSVSSTVSLGKATKTKIGGVIIGDNISISDGTISVPKATSSVYGVVKVGANLFVDEDGFLNASGGGGGGNANERVLTLEMYNELSFEEQHNGTTYYIYDATVDKNGQLILSGDV